MARKKTANASTSFTYKVGELERQVVANHCEMILAEVKDAVSLARMGVTDALKPLKTLCRKYDFNISAENHSVNDTEFGFTFRFSIDKEKLYRKRKHEALKKHLDKVKS